MALLKWPTTKSTSTTCSASGQDLQIKIERTSGAEPLVERRFITAAIAADRSRRLFQPLPHSDLRGRRAQSHRWPTTGGVTEDRHETNGRCPTGGRCPNDRRPSTQHGDDRSWPPADRIPCGRSAVDPPARNRLHVGSPTPRSIGRRHEIGVSTNTRTPDVVNEGSTPAGPDHDSRADRHSSGTCFECFVYCDYCVYSG